MNSGFLRFSDYSIFNLLRGCHFRELSHFSTDATEPSLTGYANLPLLSSFDALFPEQAPLDKYCLVLSDVQPPELAGSYNVSDLYCQNPALSEASCDLGPSP